MNDAATQARAMRVDLQLIADMVEPGSRVLDVGCEEGTLLDYLGRFKRVDGRGIELSMAGVRAAVGHGLSVIQGDADRVLPLDKTGQKLPALIKDARLTVIEGGPHAIPWTHAAQVNTALLGFLRN